MNLSNSFSILNRISATIIAVLILVSITFAASIVEVALRNSEDLRILHSQGFDITFVSTGRMADVIIRDDAELERLTGTGLHYRIVQPNLEEFINQRFEPGRDDMNGYPTYSEIVDAMFDMADDYPDIVAEPVSIGESIEGREIWAFKISDNPDDDENEPEVLITSLIHAREVITPEVTLAVMRLLTGEYGEDDYITYLVDEREIWFIPCHNPDGYVYNEEDNGELMWRKNRRRNIDGSIGVDLNRNFGYQWGYDNQGSSPDGDDPTYRGIGPFSEPETWCVREFVNDRNFVISLYYHSWGNLCLLPLGYEYIHSEDKTLFRALGTRLTETNDYFVGTCWESIYPTNGDSDDWLYMSDEHDPILAMTIEVGNREDYFWPPRNRVEPLVNDNIPTCLAAIDYADEPMRALPPLPPEDVTVYQGRDEMFFASWEPRYDGFNPPVSYNLMNREMDEPFTEEFAAENELWDVDLFTPSRVSPHSDPYCIRAEYREEMATLTYHEPIVAPDTLFAWIRFNLTRSNNLALEVSTNGFDWESAPGSITEDIVEAGYNHGPGIRDQSSNNWLRVAWFLSDWSGQMISFRFRYYSFDNFGNRDYFYIDDVGPLPSVAWNEIFAEDVEEERWTGDLELDESSEYLVQAVDAEGQRSFWSLPAQVIEAPPVFSVAVNEGWTMVSLPVELDQPALAHVLRTWIEQDVLTVIKDGFGNFFIPRHDFDLIGNWNPFYGYYIHLESEDSLTVEGFRVPVDSPMPLVLGWNTIAYLPAEPLPAEDALVSIVDNLLFVKDDLGHFWAVRSGFSDLPAMATGHGYSIKIERPDTLVYAGEQRIFGGEFADLRENTAFKPISPYNHSIILQLENPLGNGEIILRDEADRQAGSIPVNTESETIGIAAWGQTDGNSAGYANGETLRAFWRYSSDSPETELTLTLIEGDSTYQTDGFSIFSVTSETEVLIPGNSHLVDAFPNPFNDLVTIRFRLDEPSQIQLKVMDCKGRVAADLVSGFQVAGLHEISWDAGNAASGLYLGRLDVQMNGRNVVSRTKMILIR